MKFLLDVHMPPSFAKRLQEVGHTCRLSVSITDQSAPDTELIEIARKNGETILTHDLDFGTLLSFSGAASPSVVIFRVQNINTEIFFSLLQSCWEVIEKPLEKGAIVIIEPAAVRIRELPIR